MKNALFLLAMISLTFALCINVTGPVIYLTNKDVASIYPKLKPGTLTVKGQTIYVKSANEVISNYTGWLPAILVKVNPNQVKICKAYGLKVYKGCNGGLYCLQPAPKAPILFYNGNYTKLLFELNVTKGLGNPKAKVWVIELLDPFCPYCALFYRQGGGKVIIKYVKEGKIYLIPIVVAFHTKAPGYEESLKLAYQLNEYAKKGKVAMFFTLEEKIAKNVVKLYEGKMKLSNVTLPKEILEKANKANLKLAQKLFPMVATPGNVFVNVKTGKAIAVMGAMTDKGVEVIYKRVLNG